MQQCCDHPYLVDQMLQNSLTKGHPVTDILDIGVRSCGKLLLLDKMLQMIRTEGLRVLILTQVRHPWYYASIIFFTCIIYFWYSLYMLIRVKSNSLLLKPEILAAFSNSKLFTYLMPIRFLSFSRLVNLLRRFIAYSHFST